MKVYATMSGNRLTIDVEREAIDVGKDGAAMAMTAISWLRRNVRGVARMMDETKYVETGIDPVPPMEANPSLWTWTVAVPEKGGCTPSSTTGKAQSKAKPKKGGK